MRPYIDVSQGSLVISTIDVLGNRLVDAFSFSSVDLSSPADVSRKITAEIQIDKDNIVEGESGFDMPSGIEQPDGAQIIFIEPPPVVDINGEGGVLRLQDTTTVVSAEVQDIVSLNSISTVSRAITATTQIDVPNNAISNINYFENAALLDLDFNIGDVIAYIADTSKFAPSGRLMIGDEVIYYEKKLADRFYQIIRGYQGTLEQNWVAGTYLRQIEDITILSAGLVDIESESDVRMVNVSSAAGGFERKVQRQISPASEMSPTKSHLQVELTPAASGAVDTYVETAFINDPILLRNGSTVDLIENNLGNYTVTQRSGNIVEIRNVRFGTVDYIGNYIPTNVGSTIGNWQYISFDDGVCDVSNLTIGDLTQYFPALTLGDFTDRKDSSFMKSGDKFNLGLPSIQNPVAISQTAQSSIPGVISVASTTYFPTSGYMYHTDGGTFGVIKYTGKTSNQFTGCTLHSGANQITSGSEIVPISIV